MSTAVDTRLRFIPKPHTEGRATVWAVYDQVTGSEPTARPGVGWIAQDHATERDAQVEADRLNRLYATNPPKEHP